MYYRSTWLFGNRDRTQSLCPTRLGSTCEVWLEGKNRPISGNNGPILSAVVILSLLTWNLSLKINRTFYELDDHSVPCPVKDYNNSSMNISHAVQQEQKKKPMEYPETKVGA